MNHSLTMFGHGHGDGRPINSNPEACNISLNDEDLQDKGMLNQYNYIL